MAEPWRGCGAGRLALLVALAATGACTIEDRTPMGSRRDQADIQNLIYAYHRSQAADPAGDPDPGAMRVVRMDLRQEGDLAAAWVTARMPGKTSETEVLEHFVFRRDGRVWRVVNVSVARRGVRPGAGGP